MMIHRLKDHLTRVKPCRDGGNCTRQKCWYRHEKVTNDHILEKEGDTDEWVTNELDSENEDFSEAPTPEKPPAQVRNKISTPNQTPVQETGQQATN